MVLDKSGGKIVREPSYASTTSARLQGDTAIVDRHSEVFFSPSRRAQKTILLKARAPEKCFCLPRSSYAVRTPAVHQKQLLVWDLGQTSSLRQCQTLERQATHDVVRRTSSKSMPALASGVSRARRREQRRATESHLHPCTRTAARSASSSARVQ